MRHATNNWRSKVRAFIKARPGSLQAIATVTLLLAIAAGAARIAGALTSWVWLIPAWIALTVIAVDIWAYSTPRQAPAARYHRKPKHRPGGAR